MSVVRIVDRVMETSRTSGTGSISLDGAVLGFRSFSNSVEINDLFYYCIESIGTNNLASGEWEVGVGKLTSQLVLERIETYTSSNNNLKVSFSSGTKRVFSTLPAQVVAYDLTYKHLQSSPSDSWIIIHNMNKLPSVSIIDSGGSLVHGDIVYDSMNQLTVNFSAAFAGTATLN